MSEKRINVVFKESNAAATVTVAIVTRKGCHRGGVDGRQENAMIAPVPVEEVNAVVAVPNVVGYSFGPLSCVPPRNVSHTTFNPYVVKTVGAR